MLQRRVGAPPDQASRELPAAVLDVHLGRADRAYAPVPNHREDAPGLPATGSRHGPELAAQFTQRQKAGTRQGNSLGWELRGWAHASNESDEINATKSVCARSVVEKA